MYWYMQQNSLIERAVRDSSAEDQCSQMTFIHWQRIWHKSTLLWIKTSSSCNRMFKKVTESIVKQMDPDGDLVPVRSMLDHEHFRPLCLVRRKKQTTFQRYPRYKQTWYRLEDVLLPGQDGNTSEPLIPSGGEQDARQFLIKKTGTDRIDGSLILPIDPTRGELTGAASLANEWSIKLKKNHIPPTKLEALKTERKINTNHAFIQQLQKTGQKLYVVHETIETMEEASYQETSDAEGKFMAQFYVKFCAKGTRKNIQSITIPKGCTLAFRAFQLAISDAWWGLHYFPEEFRCSLQSDDVLEGTLGALEAEVKRNCHILSTLSSQLSSILLTAIKAVMGDRNLFQELSHKMEAVLDEGDSDELKTESAALKDLLRLLQQSSAHTLLHMAAAITYTLDALEELSEDQLLLLLESLENKIVSQQLKLVESILKQREHGNGFSADPSLLSFSQERDHQVTIAMLEMSGVKLHEDGSAAGTNEAFSATGALYVSLYVLSLLSKPH
ncbi:gasdermin-A-like isoform X2 [Melopsittacus undulatus]|uniref:gasdermin-A-like isoform X2 n=1 Tax=Melopsittacus undulatus TaxID=13146 RepID=UPI00146DDF34|nr:gasdermin-A-like isoform X2 [Melopsittacus undulatus]